MAPPKNLTEEELNLSPSSGGGAGGGGVPRTLSRVLFDRLIRDQKIKFLDRTDPTLDEYLNQYRDLSLSDLTRTDLRDLSGTPLTFDEQD